MALQSHSGQAVPAGYVAVAVDEAQLASPMRVCVVVRPDAEPAAGHFVVLRNTMDARILLGCLIDAAGSVHQWLQLWFQDLGGLTDTPAVCRQALSNTVLDQRWADRAAALEQIEPGAVLRTGWETDSPSPVFIDPSRCAPVHPMDAQSGDRWVLCRDDAILAAHGLPPYNSSLDRYLYLPQVGPDSPFIPITDGSPTTAACQSMTDLTEGGKLLPLNSGGRMLVRIHRPIGYEPYINLLSGGEWAGQLHGRIPLALDTTTESLAAERIAPDGEGRLFLGPHGRWGRFVETFHLKLRLLADAAAQIRSSVLHLQRPVLNITADSLQVALGPPGVGLPFFWTARAVLADPGDAVELAVAGSDSRYYLPGTNAGISVYRPAGAAGQALQGRAAVRIRQVMDDAANTIVVEGTLTTQERLAVTPNDLVWIRLNLGRGRVDLYAHLEQADAMAVGEWRLRSIKQRFADETVAALRSAAGVPMPDALFDVVPQMSSPCDLYALGVLGVRTLLVDTDTSLPMALDETLSLARQVAHQEDASRSLAQRIGDVFDQDPRWADSLGPCRLTHETLTSAEGFDLIPPDLWYDTLATLIAMFPGTGPDSECADFADTHSGGIHGVFDRAIRELNALLVRTRSLILVDWRYNRQVHAAIRKYLVGMQQA